MNRALIRLTASYGPSYGREGAALAGQQAIEWVGVLDGLSPMWIDRAISDWIRARDVWPKPSNIRNIALDLMPKQQNAYRAEPREARNAGSEARMARMAEIRKRYEKTDAPFTNTVNDPEYQAVLRDYTKATGRQPA